MPHNSHPVIRLYKQECNHGTCLQFPRTYAGILIHLFGPFSRCTKSSTIVGGLIHQGGKMKYEGVSKMTEKSMLEAVKNCLIQRPKVRIARGLASNNSIYLLSNTALCAGCFGNVFILVAYCRDSFARLAPKLGSCASTYRLSTGEVRNAGCVWDPASVSKTYELTHTQCIHNPI